MYVGYSKTIVVYFDPAVLSPASTFRPILNISQDQGNCAIYVMKNSFYPLLSHLEISKNFLIYYTAQLNSTLGLLTTIIHLSKVYYVFGAIVGKVCS